MQQQHFRTFAGVALSALVIGTTAPGLVRAQPTPAPTGGSASVPLPRGTFNPNATIVLPPASQPTSMPYPAYGTPVPGVNGGEVNPNIPQVLTLDQAIAIGYAKSPLLAQARAELQIESAPVQLARTALLPSVTGAASTERLHSQDGGGSAVTTGGATGTGATTGATTTTAGGPLTYTSNGFSVTLSQLIYDGGHVAAELRAAKYNLSSEAATYKRELQTVAYNVANAYYSQLAAQRATAVAVQTVLVDQTNEDLVSAQIRAGSAAKADLATAQLPTAQARVAVIQDQGAELSAQATFANAMGLDANTAVLPRDDTPVNGAAVTSIVAIPTYAQAFARAIALRPDVTSQDLTVSGLRATLRATQLSNFPTLSGIASAATDSTDVSGGTFRNNSSVGLSLSIPIYDQGIVAAEVAQARGNLALGLANEQTVVQGVQLNVKQALVSLVSAKAALTSSDVALYEAQVVLKSTQAQYRAGVTTLPLLLNAQVGLTQALSTQTTAAYTLRQAEQAFLYAEGANAAP